MILQARSLYRDMADVYRLMYADYITYSSDRLDGRIILYMYVHFV
jgi:hypothetical protein